VTSASRARALVADDEPLARQRLRDLLEELPAVEIVGEAADGAAAVAQIDALKPDLVFLDIQMPGLSGLEVLRRAAHHPVTIFTTAHDQYAVAAFELAAVDYLLKPFGMERLRTAVDRALATRDAAAPARAEQLLGAAHTVTRLFVRDRGKIVPLPVADIAHFEARDDYVAVYVGGRTYLMHVTLGELERRLDASRFLRIHRTHLVNLDHVRAMEPYDGTRLQVELRDGTKLMASRSRSRELRDLAR
jgi:two-component system LytT family response regulator